MKFNIFKKPVAMLLLAAICLMAMPLNAFASTISNKNKSVDSIVTTSDSTSTLEGNKTNIIQPQGWKKTVVVNALKYGGPILAKLMSYLSPEAAAVLEEWSYTLGVELSYLTNSIEARLIDFMIFDLGIESHIARAIAWVISNAII